jgi:signal transduction histidine kinase/ligand-binding sensor domain-containing protein
MYLKALFSICYILFCTSLFAQSYRIQSYNIEQGLPQTQVNALCEDQFGHIWAATLGGLARFDGLNFLNFTEQQGAPTNSFYNVIADKKGKIWLSSEMGLVRYDGKQFKTITLTEQANKNIPFDLWSDHQSTIWANTKLGGVFQVADNQTIKYNSSNGFTDSLVLKIGQYNDSEAIWFTTYKDGLWKLENNVFTKFSYPTEKILVEKIIFDQNQNPLLITPNGVYHFIQNQLKFVAFPPNLQDVTSGVFLPNGDLLLGSRAGLYRLNQHNEAGLFVTNEELNESSIRDIEYDSENNIWIATDGQGVFKASPTAVSIFSNQKELQRDAVMTICRDTKNTIWYGTYNSGLYRTTKNGIEKVKLSSKNIICSYLDDKGRLWFGTDDQGVFIIDNQKIKNIKKENGLPSNRVFGFSDDKNGTIWILTNKGLAFYKNEKLSTFSDNRLTDIAISSLLTLNKDSVLLSCKNGLYLIHNQQVVSYLVNEPINGKAAFCMAKDKQNNIWFGTMGSGLFCWQSAKQKTLQYTIQNGLASDIIYSLFCENNGTIWAGTGKGFHRIELLSDNTIKVKVFGKNEGVRGLESNQNAIFYDNGKLQFGTTRGIYEINVTAIPENKKAPKLALRAVRLFYDDKEILKYGKDTSPYYSVPFGLVLPTSQNHLTFDFIGISHSQPEGVRYRYLIEGLDKDWSPITDKTSATYSEIPPGKYIFKIMACNSDGIWTKEPMAYAFEIKTPFYKTAFFQLLVLLALIGLGAGIQAIRNRMKLNRERLIQRLRGEEQNKIRQKTAEDFHDELGNKLTRISILTDIIETKLNAQQVDLQSLVAQIKENTKELYNGTKDILWSLRPESDNLFGTVQRLRDFGVELFSETEIDFHPPIVEENYKSLQLQMDYSRNIQMICKEALNNVLRHAKAKNVYLDFSMDDKDLTISIIDDGVGFVKGIPNKGNGLQNMQLRAERVGAYFQMDASENEGTKIKIQIKI